MSVADFRHAQRQRRARQRQSRGLVSTAFLRDGDMKLERPNRSKLYDKRRWRRLAKWQLVHDPLCRLCADRGLIVPATVCDHVVPHGGDPNKFWNGARQSLCASCHDGLKQQIERQGYHCEIDITGYPTDLNYPFNAFGPRGGLLQK